MNQHFDQAIRGARELSEQELMQIQGGGIFGDAWNWVKDTASDVVDTVTHAVYVITHPAEWLPKLPSPYPRNPGPTIPPRPQPPIGRI